MKKTALKRGTSQLKRSAFKSKPTVKVNKLKSKSKQPISKIQRQIWEECKRIIRTKHGNVCYTCNRTDLAGSNWHTGHMWAKASIGAYLKYDLRILRPQCYFCNINCGGRGAEFYARMIQEHGEEYMKQLQEDRNKIVKAYDYYLELLERYKTL
jgi:hypothetical protein